MRRLLIIVLTLALAAGSTAIRSDTTVAATGWDYVYGDVGPLDYSRFQDVELSPSGGAFLVGFFSGSFEGLSSPAAYRTFVQYRGADGSARWTSVFGAATTELPKAPDLLVAGDGTAYVSACLATLTGTNCTEATFSAAGPVVVERPRPHVGRSRGVALQNGFAWISGANASLRVERVTTSLQPTWVFDLSSVHASWSAESLTVGAADDDTIWVAGDIPRQLPTQRDALAMVRIAPAGTLERTILHYGFSLSGPGGGRAPGLVDQLVTINREFLWLNVYYSGPEYNAGWISTVAFRTDNGALIGPISDVPCATPPDPSRICGGYGTKYVLLRPGEVIRGGQRVVRPYGTTGKYLGIYDLEGVTRIEPELVRSIPLDSGVGEFVIDADDDGDLVIAGATSGTVAFVRSQAGQQITAQSSPQRAFVARNPGGKVPLKLAPFVPLEVKVTGINGVPATGVSAVSLNVTVTEPEAAGFITVYPCGPRKLVSSLNYVAGQTVPNAVIAPVSPSGTVCFYAMKPAHLLADVNGWFASGSGFTSVDPSRVFDTRAGEPAILDVPRRKVGGPENILEVPVTGLAGVPSSGVSAVSLNVTVTGAPGSGFVTVYPCGDRKLVSSLNFVAGQTVPNAVIAPVSPRGTVCFYSQTDVDILADVNGWFAAGSGFTSLDPTRVFDTRPGEPALLDVPRRKVGGPDNILEVPVLGVAGVPTTGVSAVSLNVTVTGPLGSGFVTVFPCGERKLVSSLNYVSGQTVPNAVITPVSPRGTVCFYSQGDVDLLADVNGWFANGSGFTPLDPLRVFDTR